MNKKSLGLCLLVIMNIVINAFAGLSMVARVAAFKDVATTMTKDTDPYEKNEYLRQLGAFFNDRELRAIKELEDFRGLLKFLISDAYKQKRVFESSNIKTFEGWIRILDGTISLLTVRVSQQPLQQRIDGIKKIVPNIIDAAAKYERGLLIVPIQDMANNRGEMNQSELKKLVDFFEVLKRESNLLRSDQIVVLNQWVDELKNAQRITTGTKKYVDAMLEDASNTKDITKFTKTIDSLFTSTTTPESRETLVRGLNELFKARKSLVPSSLLALFKSIDEKAVSKKLLLADHLPLLTDAQLIVLRQWIGIIEKEAPPK